MSAWGTVYQLERDRASALENARLREEIERLRAALSWIEDQDPQVVAAARERFGLNEQLGGQEDK